MSVGILSVDAVGAIINTQKLMCVIHQTPTHCFGMMGYRGAGKTYGATLIADHFGVGIVDVDGREEDSTSRISWLRNALQTHPTAPYTVVDSVRTPHEAMMLDAEFDRFTLLYIRATRDTRLERLRGDSNPLTGASLEERDQRDDEAGLNDLLEDEWYDATVGNDLTRHFRRKLHGVIDGYASSSATERE